MDLDGLEKLKDSRPEEPCPIFTQADHRSRRRKRSSNDEMNNQDEIEGKALKFFDTCNFHTRDKSLFFPD